MSDTAALLRLALSDRYRIEREIGAGGMATVYLAHDIKHDRDVAIKVLHSDLGAALGAERFLSEIRTTARLQHPHILPLLDSGSADGLLYYVMPLVTGETLRARLDRERQLPIVEAVTIAREVADALGYAHGLGVIHRDIKPENILLQAGHALVADFGIALAVQSAGGARMTQTGLSLGTPQYMSPEQAMGERTIDARSDIYALGAVTYEMLAGEPPFTGPSVQAIVARLLSEDPRSLSTQRKAVPAAVENAAMRALEKLPADRFATALEFSAALIADAPAGTRATPRTSKSRHTKSWLFVIITMAVLVLGFAIGRMGRSSTQVSAYVRSLAIAIPDSMRVAFNGGAEDAGGQGSVAISGDGSRVVWVGTASIGVRLYVREMSSYAAKAVAGSDGAFAPFISHDGSILGYFSGHEMRVVNVGTGETRVLARDAVGPTGATFLDDGSVLMSLNTGEERSVSPTGTARVVRPVALNRNEAVNFPRRVPDDRYVVGTFVGGPLVVVSLADGVARRIKAFAGAKTAGVAKTIDGNAPKMSGNRLYWQQNDVVMSAAFDIAGARLTSEPVVSAIGVRGDLIGAADFDVADDGTLIFITGGDPSIGDLAWLDARGRVDTLPLPAANYNGWDISPDGRSVVTQSETPSGKNEIHVFDLTRGIGSELNVGAGPISQPGWSADGRHVILSVTPGAPSTARVVRMPTDGSGAVDTLMSGFLARQAVSHDGRTVVLEVAPGGSNFASKIYASTNGRPPVELPHFRSALDPALSPDGHWIAYEKTDDPQLPLVVERFPEGGHPTLVASNGGYEPIFSARGDRLFYRAGRRVMVATLTPGETMTVNKSTPYGVDFAFADFLGRAYRVGNDDRLLVKLLPSTAPHSEIRVLIGAR
jgi:serine/threonine-protein kinase